MTGAAIVSTTLPTIVGMGVVSRTTETMFNRGKRGNKSRTKAPKGRVAKVYKGPRGGEYVMRKGRKVYI